MSDKSDLVELRDAVIAAYTSVAVLPHLAIGATKKQLAERIATLITRDRLKIDALMRSVEHCLVDNEPVNIPFPFGTVEKTSACRGAEQLLFEMAMVFTTMARLDLDEGILPDTNVVATALEKVHDDIVRMFATWGTDAYEVHADVYKYLAETARRHVNESIRVLQNTTQTECTRDLTELQASKTSGSNAKDHMPPVKERLLDYARKGGKLAAERTLANKFGCSKTMIHNAISGSNELTRWKKGLPLSDPESADPKDLEELADAILESVVDDYPIKRNIRPEATGNFKASDYIDPESDDPSRMYD